MAVWDIIAFYLTTEPMADAILHISFIYHTKATESSTFPKILKFLNWFKGMITTTITYVKHSPVLNNATLLSTRFHYVTLIHDIWDVFWGQQNSHDSLFEATEREKQFCQQLVKTFTVSGHMLVILLKNDPFCSIWHFCHNKREIKNTRHVF